MPALSHLRGRNANCLTLRGGIYEESCYRLVTRQRFRNGSHKSTQSAASAGSFVIVGEDGAQHAIAARKSFEARHGQAGLSRRKEQGRDQRLRSVRKIVAAKWAAARVAPHLVGCPSQSR